MSVHRPVHRHWLTALGAIVGAMMMAAASAAAQAAEGAAAASTENASYAAIAGGSFRSILPSGGKERMDLRVEPFSLQRTPVTNGEFLAFVRAHPEWQRGQVASTLADGRYLQHWRGPLELGANALPGP